MSLDPHTLVSADVWVHSIVPEQAWDAIKRRLDWYMWFDWQGLGTAVQAAQKNQSTIAHLMVAARCFDMGRCRPS